LFRKDDVRVMFHEPFFYFARQSLQRNVLALVQRMMASVLLSASRVVYISIPAWEALLSQFALFRRPPMTWLPIPSTIPRHEQREMVLAIRNRLTNNKYGNLIVGHFGTYGANIRPELFRILVGVLHANTKVMGICVGLNSDKFVNDLIHKHPDLKDRLNASGHLSQRDASFYLQACDLLLQPYPDGVSSRRTSVMAGLAHGIPIVTNTGFLSEPIWHETNCVSLSDVNDTETFVRKIEDLLGDSDERSRLAQRASAVYAQKFALEQTLIELCKE
jgi:hypothetical protein